MAAHRRIDAARLAQGFRVHDLAVEGLSHAVQPLELVWLASGKLGDRRDGVSVVGGELRVEAIGPCEKRPRRREIGDVGIHLPRKHGIAGKPRLLRPFDLAVPVGALHQAHRNAAPCGFRDPSQPVDKRQRPLGVGLHREPEPVPAGERRIGEERLQHGEGEIEPLRLLRVDGERQPRVPHGLRERSEPRHELLVQPRLLRRLIAGMQRRELHRQPGPRVQHLIGARLRLAGPGGDGRHRLFVAGRVARGVLRRAGRLPQHVEGEAIALPRLVLGVVQRLLDGLAQNELVAQDAHGLAQRLADHRLAAPRNQTLDQAAEVPNLAEAPIEDVPGQHQPPGGGVDQHGVRMADMALPVARADGAGDQAVRRGGVGDAQQRLGEAEQEDTFLARQPILGEEGIDPAGLPPPGPRRLDQAHGDRLDALPLGVAETGLVDERRDQSVFVGEQGFADRLAAWQSDSGGDVCSRLAHGVNLVLPAVSFETLWSRPAGDRHDTRHRHCEDRSRLTDPRGRMAQGR